MTERTGLAPSLGLDSPQAVAFVGSGGKTSLILALARELVLAGEKVAITTTTKMYPPKAGEGSLWLLGTEPLRPEALAARLAPGRPLNLAKGLNAQGKLLGLEPVEASRLAQTKGLWVLLEADGSAGRPLKAWAEWEPVIPQAVAKVILLAGGRGLGRPLADKYVHRPEIFAQWSGQALGEPVTPAGLARVLGHESGPLSRLPAGAETAFVLTGGQFIPPGPRLELGALLAPLFSRLLRADPRFTRLAKLLS